MGGQGVLLGVQLFDYTGQEGPAPRRPISQGRAEGTFFPGAPDCFDPWDGLSTHFPNPKVM